MPPFCSFCQNIGHSLANCKKKVDHDPKPNPERTVIQKEKINTSVVAKKITLTYVPKNKEVVDLSKNGAGTSGTKVDHLAYKEIVDVVQEDDQGVVRADAIQ